MRMFVIRRRALLGRQPVHSCTHDILQGIQGAAKLPPLNPALSIASAARSILPIAHP